MCRSLICNVSAILISIVAPLLAAGIPEITSYSKVSRTGATVSRDNEESRSFHASPVYMSSKKLHSGEIIDYQTTQK